MNALEVFNYENHQVRTVLYEGEPWFVATDVAKILGYAAAKDMARRLDSDEKGRHSMPTPGGMQVLTIISESGLYNAILGSKLPAAAGFRRFVTSEVLPTIRKTGSFNIPQLTARELIARALIESEKIVQELTASNSVLTQEITELTPMAEEYKKFLDASGTLPMGAAAQILNLGRQTFFDLLREANVLQGDRRPYQGFKKWFEVKATTYSRSSGLTQVSYTPSVRPEALARIESLLIRRGLIESTPKV